MELQTCCTHTPSRRWQCSPEQSQCSSSRKRPAAQNAEKRPREEYCPPTRVLHSKTLVTLSLYLITGEVVLLLSGRQRSISSAHLSPFKLWLKWLHDNIRGNLKSAFLLQNANYEEARWHSETACACLPSYSYIFLSAFVFCSYCVSYCCFCGSNSGVSNSLFTYI